jgi:anion-transporting  ArsA/GET3 family ATPase
VAGPSIPLAERSLLFVTGKGGVGKTSIAAGLAQMLAAEGRSVLACEVDAKGDLAAAFEVEAPGFKPAAIAEHLWLMSMDTEASLREYLRLNLKIPVVGRIGPLAKAFDFVATAAPGVKEILTVGKLCYEVRERHYDTVVVDASATGHIIGQLAAPQAINDLVKVGLIRSQTDWMLDILSDPQRCGLVIVTTPEEMPVAETVELRHAVATETTVDLVAVVVNRVLPERFSPRGEAVFARLISKEGSDGLRSIAGDEIGAVLASASLATTLRRSRTQHLATLRAGLDPTTPVLLVPYLFQRADGLRATHQLAEHLAEELDR